MYAYLGKTRGFSPDTEFIPDILVSNRDTSEYATFQL